MTYSPWTGSAPCNARSAHPHSTSPHLADLDDRITHFLTRTTRRYQQDNDL